MGAKDDDEDDDDGDHDDAWRALAGDVGGICSSRGQR